MKEEFRDIKGYEGLYKVSNYGKVIRLARYKENHSKKQFLPETELKPQLMSNGYIAIYLTKNKKRKIKYIHRLVAEAFLDNPYNLPEVNHKDENKENCRVDNLEWCTKKYNVNYGTGAKRRVANTDYSFLAIRNKKYSKEMHDKMKKKVCQYLLDGTKIAEYESCTSAAEINGFHQSDISRCCNGKLKTSKGYVWKYE